MNKIMENVKEYTDVINGMKILDKNSIAKPFYNGQVSGFKIVFDCILTNSALKYIYDICENANLNLRLCTNTDNKFNLIIFKNIK